MIEGGPAHAFDVEHEHSSEHLSDNDNDGGPGIIVRWLGARSVCQMVYRIPGGWIEAPERPACVFCSKRLLERKRACRSSS